MSMPQQKPFPLKESEASKQQSRAAQPHSNVWVAASAGTGKTKVLTDRTLRLLLPREDGSPGTPPHRLLCLTYTKAAASEMALRIGRLLSSWATAEPEKLDEELRKLLQREPSQDTVDAARRLFAQVVDTPGGLKIMTIHSFCASVLGRFPLEAGLPPYFTTLEPPEADSLLRQARDAVLNRTQADPASKEAQSLTFLAGEMTEDDFDALLQKLTAERGQLQTILQKLETEEGFYRELCTTLDVEPEDTPESILEASSHDDSFEAQAMWAACAVLAQGKKTDIERSIDMQRWLEKSIPQRAASWKDWEEVFLTQKGAILKTLITADLVRSHPETKENLIKEAERVFALQDKIAACRCAQMTRHLIALGRAILDTYQAMKDRRAALDFDDLIHSTLRLLDARASWVLYKMDEGLDHILIDEAQDTNPEQWDIAKPLAKEFFDGKGARDVLRTLFVVGDIKQSIYSFQRAAPDKFLEMHDYFERQVKSAGLDWQDVPLTTSFRSTPSVLDFVDAVFKGEEESRGLGGNYLGHSSHRAGAAGLVELWPLFKTPRKEKSDAWGPQREAKTSRKAPALLAERIADTIAGWIESKEILESKNRPVQAGDILILLRRRKPYAAHLIRALKSRGVPVAGADRMILKEQLAVQDLTAVAQAALLPEDSLTLACVLKSPFIGYDDARLEELSFKRREQDTLWDALRHSGDDATVSWVHSQIQYAGVARPYEFFSRLLQSPCPASTRSGLYAMAARLGDEILDPLNEFLNRALAFERGDIATLQLFLLSREHGRDEVKREQEEAGGRVRIMTVHASKGLQAPIVFMPDTVLNSGGARQVDRLLWPDKTGLSLPVWAAHKGGENTVYLKAKEVVARKETEEYRRLFYVAATRAEDRLYICGSAGPNGMKAESWYAMARAGFQRCGPYGTFPFDLPAELESADEGSHAYRLENKQTGDLEDEKKYSRKESSAGIVIPDWVNAPLPQEPSPPSPLVPSRPSGEEPAAQSPLNGGDRYRFLRGVLTHRLLQILPALTPDVRRTAALDFVSKRGFELPQNVQHDLVAETLAILNDPDCAPLFGPESQAEVPVTGTVGGYLVSGQIDRLAILGDSVWIVDYKTNRPPPKDVSGVPDIYCSQLRAYASALRHIWPEKTVHTFLLWTDGPRLMKIETG